MFFLKVIRWHKIGKIRDSATFHEGELRKENGKKKGISESRKCRFDRSKEEGTESKRNKTTGNALKQR